MADGGISVDLQLRYLLRRDNEAFWNYLYIQNFPHTSGIASLSTYMVSNNLEKPKGNILQPFGP